MSSYVWYEKSLQRSHNYQPVTLTNIDSGFVKTCSDAASGWEGWALAHPKFGRSVNPITTRGADYAHFITASPPGFENPAASLTCDKQ